MKKIIKIFLVSILIFSNNFVFSNEIIVEEKIQNAFNSFIDKVEDIYSIDKEISLLTKLDTILNEVISNKNLDENKKTILIGFKYLNNQKLLELNIQKQKEELILELYKNEEKFKIKYNSLSNEEYFSKYETLNSFKNISYNSINIFLENGIWYYYQYNDYKFFSELSDVELKDFNYNGIYEDKALVFYNDGIIGFATDYNKIKLISDDIIYGIPNKLEFLKEIKDDKEYIIEESDSFFEELKEKSLNLTIGLSKEEKIETIYNYILENFKYPKTIDLSNKEIFSAIKMYNNGEGVCEAYVKLFMYMLNFSYIDDTEIFRGYVIDADDFPDIGHAWIRIGDNYYDPTFDDPVGNTTTRTIDKYEYFGLPKDLFYTNRYNYEELPEELKTKSSEYRKLLIQKKLFNLYNKYKDFNYNILKEVSLKIENGINYDENITINNFSNILDLYEVKNFDFIEDGKTKTIKKLSYYSISNTNLEVLLKQLNYNLNGHYFFKWYLEDSTYEYRLGYNLEF